MEYIKVTCVLVSSSVCAVDVVGLVNWESKGRGMVDRGMVDRSLVDGDMVCRGMVRRGMVDGDVLGRGMVDGDVLDRSLVDRDSVGWVLVHRGDVGRLLVMVSTRVLWGGGTSLVRPRVVWEPGRVGQVLQVGP